MFTFKQFTIDDSACAMKVGTDGVLLGAWAEVDNAATRRVLDIGTGSGLIALMLAQRLPEASVVGIDVVPEAVEAAQRNAMQEILQRVESAEAHAERASKHVWELKHALNLKFSQQRSAGAAQDGEE